MVKYILMVLFSIFGFYGMAQLPDSLFVVRKDGNWAVKYTVKPGESIRMLALRFCISEGQLSAANDDELIRKFAPGDNINIPVIPDNFFQSKPPLSTFRELYYNVAQKDDVGMVSTYSSVTKSQMRSWNNLKGNTIAPGQVLFVGWLKMIPRDTDNLATLKAYPSTRKKVVKDSGRQAIPGGLDSLYNRQTNNGMNVLTEKGTGVFFEKKGKNNAYLAFHNTTPRGTVIKVFNPGSGKSVFVKVLGPIPDTKQYANSIIGISDEAKEALGVVADNKAWLELTYTAAN